MLTGGEKSKIKRLVVAINKRYPEILDILEVENLKENQIELTKLSEIVRIVFKWTSNLSYLTITNNPILSKGFDLLQDANRKAKINTKDLREVNILLDAVDAIYDMQKELIRIVDGDSNLSKSVLKQIMDELGMESPKEKGSSSGSSRQYNSIDDLFADLED